MGETIELKPHKPEENENFKLAHRYMELYVDSLVDEYRVKKENAVLLEGFDMLATELRDIKGELHEIRQQNAMLTESMQYMDVMRLTVGRGTSARKRPDARDDSIDDFAKRFIENNDMSMGIESSPEAQQASDMRNTARLPKLQAEEYYSVFKPREDEPPEDLEDDSLRYDTVAEPPGNAATEPVKTDAEVKKPKSKVISILSNVLFYACMALLIIGAVTFAQSTDVDKSLFGFRYYYIRTGSMEPVLPVGSVVLTKVTPPEDIKIGDDITVYVGDGKNDTYLTHRVVEITEDPSGDIAFRTKGVNNKSNDPTPFSSKLLAGKVVFCVPVLGKIMTFVQTQLIFVIGIFVLLLALSFMLRLLFTKEDDPAKTPEAAADALPKLSRKERKALLKQKQDEMLREISADNAKRLVRK